jgi:thiol-disulfide isomerase/thioredoxin
MNRIVLCLLSLIFVTASYGQGYKINIVIKGEKYKEALIAVHYGANKYSIDTARINEKGKAEFSGQKPLAPGMYLIAVNGNQICDFLISDTVNQQFTISATKDKYLETLSFKGSPENEAFSQYSQFLMNRQKKEKELNDKAKGDEQTMKLLDAEFNALTTQTNEKVEEIKAKFPNSLLVPIAVAMNPLHPERSEIAEVPDSAKRRYLYDFYKKHFWDNLTLTDKRMQYTPILIPTVDNYFSSMVLQVPDSIIAAVDIVLTKAASDTAMMRFLAGHLFNRYYSSKIMGMESVVVYIIDNYYLTGKVDAKDEKFIKSVTEYADKNRETLIGKTGKNLKMETIGGGAESLYDIDSPYTIVYFFESNCGHCQQETPKVYKVFQEFKDRGVAGVCFYTRSNKTEWLEYVSKNNLTDWINVWDPSDKNDFRWAYSVYTVPQLYLLDKDKKIIGRRLDSAALSQMLNHFIKK